MRKTLFFFFAEIGNKLCAQQIHPRSTNICRLPTTYQKLHVVLHHIEFILITAQNVLKLHTLASNNRRKSDDIKRCEKNLV